MSKTSIVVQATKRKFDEIETKKKVSTKEPVSSKIKIPSKASKPTHTASHTVAKPIKTSSSPAVTAPLKIGTSQSSTKETPKTSDQRAYTDLSCFNAKSRPSMRTKQGCRLDEYALRLFLKTLNKKS
jgi:hypothetical protein